MHHFWWLISIAFYFAQSSLTRNIFGINRCKNLIIKRYTPTNCIDKAKGRIVSSLQVQNHRLPISTIYIQSITDCSIWPHFQHSSQRGYIYIPVGSDSYTITQVGIYSYTHKYIFICIDICVCVYVKCSKT